jgi:hypothetical protein
MLRSAADRIDAGEALKCIVAIAVTEDGSITNYGWGRVDSLEAIALLHLGAASLERATLRKMDG